ncbi:MAG: dimethylarginine dimethylaminohydrolase family protein [Bacteroidota bacterium]
MSTTHHSEYGTLKSLYLKRSREAMVSDEKINQEWERLRFLSRPDLVKAAAEYDYFEQLLSVTGAKVYYLPAEGSVTMDSIYCRDAAIATNAGMILCNMGKEARKPEPEALKQAFKRDGIRILGTIQSPGTVEGGDVAWIDEHTLAVGRTYRTNEEGIRQLRALLARLKVDVWVADMPHYKGPSDVFHLMSVFSPVDKDLAVVYSPLMPIAFRDGLLKRGYRLIEVPDAEFDSMGCNVLALAPSMCLMVKGNPITKQRLKQAGCVVHEYEGAEISVKGGGGPTCLTRPMERVV